MTEDFGFVDGGRGETLAKEGGCFRKRKIDDLERAGGAGDFFQGTFFDEIVDMLSDGGDGREAQRRHDFAIRWRFTLSSRKIINKVNNKRLFFRQFSFHVL